MRRVPRGGERDEQHEDHERGALNHVRRAVLEIEVVEERKPDDNAADRAIAAARKRYPAADVAAEAVVIYDLHRDGAPGMDGEVQER